MFTLTDQAHEAVRLLSTSTTGELVPGLRISRRSDRPTFAVKRAAAPQEMDHVVEHDGARVFLAPIAAILGSDYWITKNRHIDVPALYRAHGRYRYNKYGSNWRAAIALVVSITPNIPGMASQVNPSLKASVGNGVRVYYFFYLYGFTSAFLVYAGLSHFFPATETLIESTIYEDEATAGIEYKEGESPVAGSDEDEKRVVKDESHAV